MLFGIFISNQVLAQTVSIDEDFSDGDHTNNPSWNDPESKYEVNSEILHLNAPEVSGEAVITTSSSAAYGEWEIFVRLDFNPSGFNLARFYIISDTQNIKEDVNGYFIEVGGTDDEVSLYRQTGSEVIKVIDGTDGLVDSNPVRVRIRVTRDLDGHWELFADPGGGTSFASQGTTTDNTYNSSSYLSIFSDYTSTRHDLFEYDDIKVTKINPPLEIQQVDVAGNHTIDVIFNVDIDPSSVSESDFFIDKGIENPDAISFPSTNVVRLDFTAPVPGGEYTLTVNNIDDNEGNPMDESTFHFHLFDSYTDGDIIINEFAYDPPASFDVEYIELKNTSDKYLNLQKWSIEDEENSATISSEPVAFGPGDFLVISPDTSAIESILGRRNYIQLSSMPALNNDGDIIKIVTDNTTTADSLSYTPDWGGEDVALERRSVTAPSTLKENWADSPNPNGGTPGLPNEVETDNTPPFFEDLIAINAATLRLVFSESITATDKYNYQIEPYRNIQFVVAQDNTVELLLSEELVSEETYEVTATDISDVFGNTLSGASREITFLRIDDAQPRDIVINEIMYDPGDEAADFIELYNISDNNFDLRNWRVGDSTNETSFNGGQLMAHEYVVLSGDKIFANSISNGIYISGFPALNNYTEDAVYIKNNENQTIDSLRYSQTWGGTDGNSLERKDPLAASNDASNWLNSTADNGNSAGSKNAGFQKDISPPEVIFSKIEPDDTIVTRFNEFVRLNEKTEFLMDGQKLNVVHFDSVNANLITLRSPSAKSSVTNSTSIIARNISDVKGNTTATTEVAVAQPLQPADVVINEIMFNPLNDPDDNQPDQGEYIELRNTRDYAISLEGLFLHDEPDENGEIRDLQPVISTAKWVPAQGKVLVHADPAVTFENSRVANFFGIEAPNPQSMMRIDRTTLSLASTDDAIYIADSTGATIDSVFYDESWHNPNIIDTRGIALERITPDGPSNDKTNWGSSITKKGGTPTRENSIYQENPEGPAETGISFTPNPFSPDDDGYEDNLFINYKLDRQDYLIKVQIFDRYGRLVRELADGEQAGFEGQLIWDGRKNDGSRNRIGIYIVVFEAYDSASGEDKSFKKTVVLARRLN